MAKKQSVPDTIVKQFNKCLFNIGDAVLITWLGTKKYGYVKSHKTTNWGIQYLVETTTAKYPCGISIKGYKTAYTTGCIDVDGTRANGQDELKRRIQTGHKTTSTSISRDPRRSEIQSQPVDTISKHVSTKHNRKSTTTGSRFTAKNDSKHVSNELPKPSTRKRKNSKLDDAIQRQRDFLNGFVKNSD